MSKSNLIRRKKLIAVAGASGAGKTTIATKIARELAVRGNNVILVHCDSIISQLPLATTNLDANASLMKLANANISDEGKITNTDMLKCLNWAERPIDKKIRTRIGFLGILPNEIMSDYTPISMESAERLFSRLLRLEMVDYVIVDCESNMFTSHLSYVALLHADERVVVYNADIKSVGYNENVMKRLSKQVSNWKPWIILNKVKPTEAVATIKVKLGGSNFTIEEDENIQLQFLDGLLLKELNLLNKVSRNTSKALKELVVALDYQEEDTDEIKEELKINESEPLNQNDTGEEDEVVEEKVGNLPTLEERK